MSEFKSQVLKIQISRWTGCTEDSNFKMDGIGYREIEPKCEQVSEPRTEDSNFKMDGIGYWAMEAKCE